MSNSRKSLNVKATERKRTRPRIQAPTPWNKASFASVLKNAKPAVPVVPVDPVDPAKSIKVPVAIPKKPELYSDSEYSESEDEVRYL